MAKVSDTTVKSSSKLLAPAFCGLKNSARFLGASDCCERKWSISSKLLRDGWGFFAAAVWAQHGAAASAGPSVQPRPYGRQTGAVESVRMMARLTDKGQKIGQTDTITQIDR